MYNDKTEKEKMTQEISRLSAALDDVNFECKRLSIINSNLDFQIKEAKREIKQNIAVLEALEKENKKLKRQLKDKNNGI